MVFKQPSRQTAATHVATALGTFAAAQQVSLLRYVVVVVVVRSLLDGVKCVHPSLILEVHGGDCEEPRQSDYSVELRTCRHLFPGHHLSNSHLSLRGDGVPSLTSGGLHCVSP